MILSTSPNLLNRYRQNLMLDDSSSAIDKLRQLNDIGFRCFDFNFCDYVRGESSPFRRPDWQEWLQEIDRYARQNGIRFYQAHGHMFESFPDFSEDLTTQLIERSVIGSSILGVQWVIFHAYPRPDDMERTWQRMDQLLDLTQQYKVGLAIENSSAGHAMPDADALIRLLDRYPGQSVGVCWDTGHANINRTFKQGDELRKLGSRLKALHVADNAGRGDDHLAPYMGTIDWPDILRALKDIGYQGTFNFECHNQAIRIMDPDLRLASIRLIHAIGLDLVRQYEQMGT